MRLTFYANACCLYEERGVRLLCDPWLVDGAFEGSWFHFPPLKTKPEDLCNVDGIYISHLHPDHLDPKTLASFPKDIPIIILKRSSSFLKNMLLRLGFSKFVEVEDAQGFSFGPFFLTLFPPFEINVFHPAKVNFELDTALVVESSGQTVLNANDNTPSLEAARKLKERYGHFHVAQLNHNAAGPYPSCFNQLGLEEKLEAKRRLIKRNLDHLLALSKILNPDWVMPFAGWYVLGGKQWPKNELMANVTWDNAADFLKAHGFRALLLNEGLTFDLDSERVVNGLYVPIDDEKRKEYIETILAAKIYPYETEGGEPIVEIQKWLKKNLPLARINLWHVQTKHNYFPDFNFYIQVGEESFYFNWNNPQSAFVENIRREPYLECRLDLRFLRNILTRRAHWNNAEIGCHIDFVEKPEDYRPDMHVLLSFFQLPFKDL